METGDSAPANETQYVYDNAWSQARERLSTLELRYDPGTIRNLESLGIRDGWHCLEVGAGGGSIAEWLCGRVGSSGRVVAIDVDTRFIDLLDLPNLEVRRQDIASEAVEAAAFDLVHARMLLEHVPGRDDALRRMVAALRPGGWILLEEFDHVTLLPDASADERILEVWGKFLEAYRRLMTARGGDLDYGRRLFGLLRSYCLMNVSAEGQAKSQLGGDGLGLSFHQLRVALVATGEIEDREMGLVLSLLDDPAFAYVSPLMIAASGQRATT
jgi:SAM-dependent methyltransferase